MVLAFHLKLECVSKDWIWFFIDNGIRFLDKGSGFSGWLDQYWFFGFGLVFLDIGGSSGFGSIHFQVFTGRWISLVKVKDEADRFGFWIRTGGEPDGFSQDLDHYNARCRIAVVGFCLDLDVLVFIAASGLLVFHGAFLWFFRIELYRFFQGSGLLVL